MCTPRLAASAPDTSRKHSVCKDSSQDARIAYSRKHSRSTVRGRSIFLDHS